MNRYIISLIIVSLFLNGCKTIAERYELIDGSMVVVEKMELRGVGKNKADFKAKKIENDSGFKVPFGGTSVRDLPTPNLN